MNLTDPDALEEEDSFVLDSEQMQLEYLVDISDDSSHESEDSGMSNAGDDDPFEDGS